MTTQHTRQYILIALATALVWLTLGLRLYLSAQDALNQGNNPLLAILDSFRYFTLLTTLLAALALTAQLFPKPLRHFTSPGFNTLVATSILLVALVYTLLLRDLWQPQGLRKLVDVLLHDIIPVVFILYWWLIVPKKNLHWSQLKTALLYPVIYLTAILIRGAFTGDYPYPFINVVELGYFKALVNAAGLVVVYGFLFVGFIAISRTVKNTSL